MNVTEAQEAKSDPASRTVVIDYTNWRGERSSRSVVPERLWWGSTEFHPEDQFLLHAFDVEKQAWRDFAMAAIHSWTRARTATRVASTDGDAAGDRPTN